MPTLEELAAEAQSQNLTKMGQSPDAMPAAPPIVQSYNAGPDDTAPRDSGMPSFVPPAAPVADNAGAAPNAGEAAPAWVEHLKQHGIDAGGFKSEADLAAAYVRQQRELDRLSPYAQYGQQFLPYAQQITQMLQKNQQPPAETKPVEPVKTREERLREHWSKLWERPQFDPSWESQLQINPDTGLYEGVNAFVPAHIVSGANQYRDWQRRAMRQLVDDPFEVTWKAMQPGIEDVVQEILQRELSAYRVSNDFEQLEKQYAPFLYQHDAQGRPVVDPITGEYQYTPLGQFTLNKMRQLQQIGVTDPYANFQTALDMAKAHLYDLQQQEALTSQQPGGSVPPSPQAAHAQPAAVPSMYGAAPAPPVAPAPQQSFLDRARSIAAHGGNMSGAASPSGGQAVQSFDSESFFTRAAAQMGVLPSAA